MKFRIELYVKRVHWKHQCQSPLICDFENKYWGFVNLCNSQKKPLIWPNEATYLTKWSHLFDHRRLLIWQEWMYWSAAVCHQLYVRLVCCGFFFLESGIDLAVWHAFSIYSFWYNFLCLWCFTFDLSVIAELCYFDGRVTVQRIHSNCKITMVPSCLTCFGKAQKLINTGEWLQQASHWHGMYCHDLEVMSSDNGRSNLECIVRLS